MAGLPSKQMLKDELAGQIKAQLDTLERAYAASREAATHEEAKPENDKDTRALEQSYIARGQALRVEEQRASLAEVLAMPVRDGVGGPALLGALVTLEEDDKVLVFLLAPHGGGALLAGGAVQVVTPKSALGRAVLGKHVGDDCEARVAERTRELRLIKID